MGEGVDVHAGLGDRQRVGARVGLDHLDGSASQGAALVEAANLEENSPKLRCWDFSRTRPKAAMSQKAVEPPLPSTTS